MADFIPLVTNDYRLAFCQATRNLPELAQVSIWKKVMQDVTPPSTPPPTPIKPSPRLNRLMNNWKARRQLF
jgi:hypothetical protein